MTSKLDNEVNQLKRQINNVNDSKDKLKESYSLYSKSLAQTEQELLQVQQESQALVLEVNALKKSTLQTLAATAKIDLEINQHVQGQISIEKGTLGAKKDTAKIYALVREKEALIVSVQNDLSQVKYESLNVSIRISEMKKRLSALDKELFDRNAAIEKYELEIRKRNDELGKKQSEMDLLNKKYDSLTGKTVDESMGPLEATIHNVTKAINAREKECAQLSQFWIKAQDELVLLSKKTSELNENTLDSRVRLTILERKKMVIDGQFQTEEKASRDHQKNIRKLQNDMIKINVRLSKQSSSQTILQENNLTLELEYRAILKKAEIEAVQLEEKIEKLKTDKERALEGIIEAE